MTRNIAVIGCGYWGKNLVRNFAQLGALHTICDADTNRLDELKSLYPGVNTQSDYQQLLENQEIRNSIKDFAEEAMEQIDVHEQIPEEDSLLEYPRPV